MTYIGVYGSLKRGFLFNSVLGDAEFVGEDKIEGFDMYNLGTFPAAIKNKDSETPLSLEVFKTDDPGILDALDRLEGYPDFYNKGRYETVSGQVVTMYYISNHPERITDTRPFIESGVWTKGGNTDEQQ